MLNETGSVEVLLVGDGPQVFSLSQRQLERKACRCHFARSQRGLEELLNQSSSTLCLPCIESKEEAPIGLVPPYRARVPLCSMRCPLKSAVGGCPSSGLAQSASGLLLCVRESFPMSSMRSSMRSGPLRPNPRPEAHMDDDSIYCPASAFSGIFPLWDSP